jgi:two-component system response regulator HydG
MSELTLKPTIEQEYKIILSALEKTNFNKTKAAELLKIDRKTLYNKITRYQKEVLNKN